MLWKSVLLLLVVVEVLSEKCKKNESYATIISCESSCKHLRQQCKLTSKCTCKHNFFRDPKNGLCVTKSRCSNYLSIRIRESINKFIAFFIPKPILKLISLAQTMYGIYKFTRGK
ncbi:unnamed protein product [Tenebrio molitor]|nr:unnamed protein product [Tenebrio molitor]